MNSGLSDRELNSFVVTVVRWASTREDVRAVALVGSYARGAAIAGSDVDLVVVSTAPHVYVEDDEWVESFGQGTLIATRSWGALTERRLRREDGLEIDVGLVDSSWATTEPVDTGTAKVVKDGMRILYDPKGQLQRLVSACS